jgi:hypothetical protein
MAAASATENVSFSDSLIISRLQAGPENGIAYPQRLRQLAADSRGRIMPEALNENDRIS